MTTKKSNAIVPIPKGDMVPLNPKDSLPICTSAEQQVIYLTIGTPPQFIKRRMGRAKKVFDYIETSYVIGRLNAIFNFDWNLETVWQEVDRKEGQVAVKVRLTVRFLDGKIVIKEAYGSSDIKTKPTGDQIDFADDLKAAQSDGMKKAASLLGIGWDVYSGLAKASEESFDTAEDDDFSAEPKPQTQKASPVDDDQERFRTIDLQLANGRRVKVSKYEALGYFGKVKAAMGEEAYYAVLKLSGYAKSGDIPPERIPAMYQIMVDAYRSRTKVEPPPQAATQEPASANNTV